MSVYRRLTGRQSTGLVDKLLDQLAYIALWGFLGYALSRR